MRWRRCQQRAKIQTALVHLRLWKHIFCEVHPVGTVVGQAPHNSKPVLKFYQVPPAICFRCVVTPSWYLTNLSDDPEWLDCHKAKRPHPPSNGPPTKRPGFWVETFETLGTWSFGVQMPVMKCRSAKQGDSTDFHSFGCGRVPKKHWVVVLDEGTYVLPGSSWWGLPHCPSGKVEVGGARLVSVGRCSTGWDLSRPEKFHCLWGGSYQWVFGGVLKVGYPQIIQFQPV